jgi:flagellar FliL protein
MSAKPEGAEGAPKKSLNMGLIMKLAFAVVNLGVTGGGAYLVYASTLGWKTPVITEEALVTAEEKEAASKMNLDPFIYTMDKFTVNLDGKPQRTIRIEVNLEMLGKEGFEEVINTANRAKARDKIVRLLNEKNYSELETIQGKLFLKDKIAMEMNGLLRQGVVKDVFFSEFVVE